MIFNKKFKLQSYFDNRIPLCIRRRNNIIYFQTQTEIARDDGLRHKTFSEAKYKTNEHNIKEVGMIAHKLLKKFEDTGDLSISEYEDLIAQNIDQDEKNFKEDGVPFLIFHNAKDWKDLERNYDFCSLDYDIFRKKYSFRFWWLKRHGGGYYQDCSENSLGEPGVLTFDTPLEFTDHSDPEKLGEMIIEALDRSRKIGEKVSGNYHPPKIIELAGGSEIIVEAPRDRHFTDDDDYGVCEVYQVYGYYPREDCEEASAVFYIGMAAELDGEINEDKILSAWEKQNGKAEFFEVKAAEHGIFKFRAEMRNKKVHRIPYLSQIADCDLLDCTMELRKPNSRKKLDEKLSGLFEDFAWKCRFKG